ncbi:MAG TPA: cytidylate kinase family protein [Candidatus Sulfomarinibacteraceae bacterium]|nr:cytidylate kinase family protein [Candidatus Sulfomarinibacteraceae bacterium]
MPIITISRGICSGGTQLAELVGSRLGWPVLSQDDVATAGAKRYHMSEEELQRGLHLPATFYERFTHRKTRYLLATQATIVDLLEGGNGVYHGLAGQFLFQNVRNAFKVRIVTPMSVRVDNAVHRMRLSREEAIRRIRTADEQRLLWGRQVFDADVNDPDLYDLVVNLDQVTLATAANLIAEIMQDRDHRPGPDSVREFEDFALERRIRAELFFNSPFAPDAVQVAVRNGEVHLSGDRAFEDSRDTIVEFIGRIPGVATMHADGDTVEAMEVVFDPASALSSRDARASDVMLAIDRYPHCKVSCTIRDAMVAISASAIRFEDGHIVQPRYVLLHDQADQLVGVVSRRELLKGLVPHLVEDRESAAHIRELVPFGGTTPSEIFIRWTSMFSKAAIRASKQPVRSVMAPIRGTVKADDSLSTVISTMLYHGVDLVAVLDGGRVVGVVLMTNIFDIIAQFVMEHGGEPGSDHD